MSAAVTPFAQHYFHGTRAALVPGEYVKVGHNCNYAAGALSWVYFAATLDAAIWGAELALGSGQERVYVVEPTGPSFDDPNVTDKRHTGNPTMSYRSREPLRIVGEVVGWRGHSADQLQQMRDALARLRSEGMDVIID